MSDKKIKCTFLFLPPRCVIYSCDFKFPFVYVCVCGATLLGFTVKCHVWFQTSELNRDKDKNWEHWIIYTPHVICVHKLSSTVYSFHSCKQYLVKISQFSCQSWLRHFSTVTWGSEGSFGSFECISSLKVVCSRAYVWIWGLFEGRCSSWLHPFSKLPPGNWPLF